MFILELDLVNTYENFIAVIAATYVDESDSEDSNEGVVDDPDSQIDYN